MIRNAFIAELKSSDIKTLDELNEAFVAWADIHYNHQTHGETGQKPLLRWRAGIDHVVRWADELALQEAFLWRENRTPDKTGVFSLFGIRYQAQPTYAKRRIEVRYDPESLDEVELWYNDQFIERVKPFSVNPHRRPKPQTETKLSDAKPQPNSEEKPLVDWLGHLVQKRRKDSLGNNEPTPRQMAEHAKKHRLECDQAICDLLEENLDVAVFNEGIVREYLNRFGPFDIERAGRTLGESLLEHGTDHHVTFYLDLIKQKQHGDAR